MDNKGQEIKEDISKDNNHKISVDSDDVGKRRWYAVHTYSGYEDAVARYLKQRVESLSMEEKIFNIMVPKEKQIRIRNGKKKVIEEKIYPGYVLVDMVLTEDSWYVVRNTPRVMGFVGPDSTKPTPLSKNEMDYLVGKMNENIEVKFKIDFSEGELVKIVDGPFKDYEGRVVGIDEGQGRVKIAIPVFGRDTNIEIESVQVEKI